jgi:hypothetical protein
VQQKACQLLTPCRKKIPLEKLRYAPFTNRHIAYKTAICRRNASARNIAKDKKLANP